MKNKINHLTPEFLEKLRWIATIESIGASTRLAGSKLSNEEVEKLLLRLESSSFKEDKEDI